MTSTVPGAPLLEPVKRMSKDIARAAHVTGPVEARFLVDAFYQMQRNRIATENQIRSMEESCEPHDVLLYLKDQHEILEGQMARALGRWTDGHPVGRWMKSIVGIGPVIAAGMLAHFRIELPQLDAEGDIIPGKFEPVETAGRFWNFAGLNPDAKWEKGQKRPWNAKLKTLCWKAGESFVKVQGKPDDVYGRLYAIRKARYQEANERGNHAATARQILQTKKIDKDTDVYKWYVGEYDPKVNAAWKKAGLPLSVGIQRQVPLVSEMVAIQNGDSRLTRKYGEKLLHAGIRLDEYDPMGVPMLPPDHLHSRSKRYGVKIFLSHLHHVWYTYHFRRAPKKPFAIAILNHAHEIEIPNLDLIREAD